MRRICVFCGSNSGSRPAYREAARQLGTTLAERGVGVVYGGGRVGLMGELADAALARGGEVIGVIPEALFEKEVGHPGLTELHRTRTMHERKALMAELSDAFVALPGGIGTLEELFEVWTWAQLGFHGKAVALYDVEGYFGPLLAYVDRMVEQGFLRQPHRDLVCQASDPAGLIDVLQTARTPAVDKWLDPPI
ncbi:MAG: TIGR00730 family Rossman fold protein [Acidobacteriota bacterium]